MTLPTFRQAGQPAVGALRHQLTEGAAAPKPIPPSGATPSGVVPSGAAPAKAEAVARPARAAGSLSGKSSVPSSAEKE